jgi:acetyl-CoA C-acetyltransferase
MQRYMHEYGVGRESLSGFTILAHGNAVNNPQAMFRKAINIDAYLKSPMVCSPLSVMDAAPFADGAAAVILARPDMLSGDNKHPAIRVSGSSVVIDTLALHDRPDPLVFMAAAKSVERACKKAGILPGEVDFFELSDNFSIYAVLSLEAAGFAGRGEGWKMAMSGELGLQGRLPVCTMGGLKGRGNPVGASGVYQVVDAIQQLRGQAGLNQVSKHRRALVQSLGGPASTAISHVLERID